MKGRNHGGKMGLPTMEKVPSGKDGLLLVEAQQNVVETQNGIWVDPSTLGWIMSMSESAPRFLAHFLFYFESFVILSSVLSFTFLFLPISPLLITDVLHLYLVPLSVKAQLAVCSFPEWLCISKCCFLALHLFSSCAQPACFGLVAWIYKLFHIWPVVKDKRFLHSELFFFCPGVHNYQAYKHFLYNQDERSD